MDLEPWRCRRTDGKNWRCRKPTITNEKYCEKHMHRGSKLTRKPQNLDLTNPNPDNNSCNYRKITNFHANLNEEPHLPTPKIPTTVVIKSPSFGDKKKEAKNVVKDKSVMNERIAAITLSSGLDFFPKSVLQDGQKYPRVETSKIDLDPEVERCRRTDGKRWRCRKNVLPNQKYCANHMNRGVKRSCMALSTFVVNFSVQKQGNLTFSRTINSGESKHDSLEDDSETTMTDESADSSDLNVLSS